MTKITVNESALSAFIVQVLTSLKMRSDDAGAVADVLTWANLRGVDSHGVARLPGYISEIAAGQFNPVGRPLYRSRLPGTFVLECSGTAGPVCMMEAARECIRIASELGVGVGVVSAPTHVGAIGYYTQAIAKQGFAALVMVAGRLLMAYHGAKVASLGTSPISIAVPGAEAEPPLLLDMATGLIAAGRIRQAAQERQALPDNAAIDIDGNLTTDPERAKTVLPLGGPKGSGLALLFECLTGILAGTPIVAAAATRADANPLRADHQRQDRKDTWHRSAAHAPRPRRRCDRITLQFAAVPNDANRSRMAPTGPPGASAQVSPWGAKRTTYTQCELFAF